MATVLGDLQSGEASLDIAIVGGRAMRSFNRRFRNIDETTDVLSFPPGPSGPESPDPENPDPGNSAPALELDHIGDIVISIDEALRQAEEDTLTLDVAIDRLLIHGVLHLHGFDHHTARDTARMRRKENRLLEKLHGAGLPGYAGR